MKKVGFLLCGLFLVFLVGCSRQLTVTFHTNGAPEIEPLIVEKGAMISLTNVGRTGYDFLGWFIDEAFDIPFSVEDPILSDLNLYAKWEIKKFTVVFKDYDDSVLVTRSDIAYGSQVTAPVNPVRVGHTFTGWSASLTNITSNTTITAQYSIDTYQVQFYDYQGAPVGALQTIEHGADATAPTDTQRIGYAFLGWDVVFTQVTSDLEVHPMYEILTFTVEFQDFNGARIGEAQTITYNEDATAPSEPTRLGYVFDSWDKAFTNVTSNLIIRATYVLFEYSVTYYDGTSELEHLPDTFTINITTTLSGYDKTGFIFDSWYQDAAFTQRVTSISAGTSTNVVLYGKWFDESLTYTLNYELNGGTWTWDTAPVTSAVNGINAFSNLPDTLMLDFYMYLKENGLLTSSVVSPTLHKTTWEDFKKDYDDPYAIYNHTSSNTAANNNGYSQLFYTTATGDPATHQLITIDGGFFGTEPYKSKYANFVQHLSLLLFLRGYNTEFWYTPSSKSLGGFVLDGYFYGTQSVGTGDFLALRMTIPNTNLIYRFEGSSLVPHQTTYQVESYVQGLEAKLVSPIKDGHFFAGWYDNPSFNGESIFIMTAGQTPAAMYYAKWIPESSIE